MGLGVTFKNDLALLIFEATAIANIADNAASGPIGSIYFGLHTGDPSGSSDETTSEAAYGSYAREAVTRDGTGFDTASGVVNPAAEISFTEAASGSETETHFHAGIAASGTGKQLVNGTVTPNISVVTAVTPILTTATAITFS